MGTESNTTAQTVHQRIAAVMHGLSYIPKGRGDGVAYTFRGIDAVMNHLHPLLAEHGLFLSPRVLDDWSVVPIEGTKNRTQFQATFRVCVDVWGADGDMVTLGPGLAQSHDYGDKAVYQAQQNAIKYVLLEAFAIPTEEGDMDARQADEAVRWSAAEFAAEHLSQFDGWDVDRQRSEWVIAAGGRKPTCDAEGLEIVERMRLAYAIDQKKDRVVQKDGAGNTILDSDADDPERPFDMEEGNV